MVWDTRTMVVGYIGEHYVMKNIVVSVVCELSCVLCSILSHTDTDCAAIVSLQASHGSVCVLDCVTDASIQIDAVYTAWIVFRFSSIKSTTHRVVRGLEVHCDLYKQ